MYLAHSFMSDEKRQQHQQHQQPLILVVENHDDGLLLMSYTLELLGCQSICQKESSTTVFMAKEHQPDLILLNIFLPGVNGLDFIRYLKQEPLTCHIPVVAMTVLTDGEYNKKMLEAGFDDYIVKPYMIEELAAIIYRFLGTKFELCSVLEVQRIH
ncbi:response regulator [Dolichospermum compactum]|uniref:Response regulator receiver domain protein n=1 Tax=Dolichospermum compactum NIES-806 TaxID=1973481 RepID=A0A1Z4V9Q2_9CYAN|nr:response regulator [Dolichospermum compactum]BAZ88178.1 response regulator receiver domain protein [Dolichospermum compactum NIES-806]